MMILKNFLKKKWIFGYIFGIVISPVYANTFVFMVQDKEGRSYTVRPLGYTDQGDWDRDQLALDLEGKDALSQANEENAASTGDISYLSIERDLNKDAIVQYFMWQRQIYEGYGPVLEERWVVCDETGVVGEFDYAGESTSLIHPMYRGKGLGKNAAVPILDYLCSKIETLYVKQTIRDEEQAKQAFNGDFLNTIQSFEDFKKKYLQLYEVTYVPYEGFYGTISIHNIPSLKVALSQHCKSFEVEGHDIRVNFPPKSEAPEVRELVENLVSTDSPIGREEIFNKYKEEME